MTYGIALFPSKELQDEANSFRKRFDSHYASIPPHITLTDPFEVDEEKRSTYIDSLESVASEQPPVVIEIYKADSFIPLYHKVFLKIREHETLLTLHQKLHSPPFSSEMAHTFVPHITIAQDLPKAENDDLIGQLKMSGFSHSEIISEFHLIQQQEDGRWNIVKTFELKGE